MVKHEIQFKKEHDYFFLYFFLKYLFLNLNALKRNFNTKVKQLAIHFLVKPLKHENDPAVMFIC